MFKNTQRKGLWNRLAGAGLDTESAIAIVAAAYPDRGQWEPPERPIASPREILDAYEKFIRRSISADTLFRIVFGKSQSAVLGFGDLPDSPPSEPEDGKEVFVLKADLALYTGRCINCKTTERPVYPGWQMLGVGVWACKQCITDRPGDNSMILGAIQNYEAGKLDIQVPQEGAWKFVSDLHLDGPARRL